MKNLELSKNDYEKCELYQRNKSEQIVYEFYQKFGNEICNLIYSKIINKFYSIPIERDDILHLVWFATKSALDDYNKNKNNNLMRWIITKSYQSTIREIRKFLSNGEKVMNNAISYENYLETRHNFESKSNNICFIQKSYNQSYIDISNFIISRIKKLNKNDVKKVIYLKSQGYKNIEIQKRLNFSKSYVRKIISTIKKIGMKY